MYRFEEQIKEADLDVIEVFVIMLMNMRCTYQHTVTGSYCGIFLKCFDNKCLLLSNCFVITSLDCFRSISVEQKDLHGFLWHGTSCGTDLSVAEMWKEISSGYA